MGLLALLLAYEGFRRGDRKLRMLHVGALLFLVFAWNNRDKAFPGFWMHLTPPWKYMLVITRWRPGPVRPDGRPSLPEIGRPRGVSAAKSNRNANTSLENGRNPSSRAMPLAYIAN